MVATSTWRIPHRYGGPTNNRILGRLLALVATLTLIQLHYNDICTIHQSHGHACGYGYGHVGIIIGVASEPIMIWGSDNEARRASLTGLLQSSSTPPPPIMGNSAAAAPLEQDYLNNNINDRHFDNNDNNDGYDMSGMNDIDEEYDASIYALPLDTVSSIVSIAVTIPPSHAAVNAISQLVWTDGRTLWLSPLTKLDMAAVWDTYNPTSLRHTRSLSSLAVDDTVITESHLQFSIRMAF
jgi:hypothetical protein